MSYFSHFTNLEVYRSAREFRRKIWDLAAEFPYEEKYRLKDQILRSTRKCTANIAEGNGRFHWQENIQFCRIARGSLTETQDHLSVALDCNYITDVRYDKLLIEVRRVVQLLNGYIRYLETKRDELGLSKS
jgi:four helix bundle protein